MKRLFTIAALGVCLSAISLNATTSPYATGSTGPLNQSATDEINGKLAISTSTADLSVLTDATSSLSPTGSVILAPGTESVDLTWDLGAEVDPSVRQLLAVSIWLADDPARNGIDSSLWTSLDGVNFSMIDGSSDVRTFASSPGDFHNVFFDFSGTNVTNFRYIRLSAGAHFDPINPLQSPALVEVDVITSVPEPATITLLAAGVAIVGMAIYRKRQTA